MDMTRITSIVREQEDQHRRRRGRCGRGIVLLNFDKEERDGVFSFPSTSGFVRGGGRVFFFLFRPQKGSLLPRGARNMRSLALSDD